MNTEELQLHLEGLSETQSLDFKADMPWDCNKIAKDVLAMSNSRDGGLIIIGVKESGTSFSREGVSAANMATYKIDIMRDQLLKFADPTVDIGVTFPVAEDGKQYVVIKVFPFREVPIISKKDIPNELKSNTIYYRNTNKRVESAAISNAADLRDLVELAAIKLMNRRRSFGYTMPTSEANRLDTEFNSIPDNGLLSKIKSKGYWEVRFQPVQIVEMEPLQKCLEVVEKSQARFGWVFPKIPHFNNETEQLLPAGDCYEASSEGGARKEFWRMYKSQQFVLFRALVEDWYADDSYRRTLADTVKPETVLTMFTSVIHFITEAVSFLSRLGTNGLYKDGVRVSLTLHKSARRKLDMDAHRIPFLHEKITGAPFIKIEEERSINDFMYEGMSIATGYILKVFDAFGYNPVADSILADQNNYVAGRS